MIFRARKRPAVKALLVAFAFVCSVVVIYACGQSQSPVDCAEAIPWHEAPEHIGESAVIEGPVDQIFGIPSPEQQMFGVYFNERSAIYVGDENVTVRVYIDEDGWDKFRRSGLFVYKSKTVCVRGKIREFHGPYMRIDSPDDIEIVE